MKSGVRNINSRKKLKMAISRCWISLLCALPYIFHSFNRKIGISSMLCENKEKSLNLQIRI